MDQKMFSIVAGVILPLVHRGQRRRVLIAGATPRPCVQRRGPRWQAPLHIARLSRRAIALTPKAVRLRHFARVA
jgi:hypothetical protein